MTNQSSVVRNGVIALCSLSSALFAAAPAPAYKVAQSFGQQEFKATPLCVAMSAKDQLVVLVGDGTVVLYDTEGKTTGSFKPDMKPLPSTLTVADDKIYLFGTVKEERTREVQGQKVKTMESIGIQCSVYDASGTKASDIQLPGARSAADAHFIGKDLVIADLAQQSLIFYQITGDKGKVTRKIDKVFRLCCGIFDFCPSPDANSLMVANLGAFQVQTYRNGRKVHEFGARGEKDSEFHGCCNPVNVACLADGSTVTVEKATTRVKIYDKSGKTSKPIAGLGELVSGCTTIPITVDSKGALYLASASKNCIVKCVSGAADPAATATPFAK